MTQRHVLERAADVFAFRHGDHRAEENGREHPRLNRLPVDFFTDQAIEDERPLRVRHEHEPAAVVVVRQIMVPRVAHVVVLHPSLERGASAAAGEQPLQPRERHLTVQRSVRPAFRSEARELLLDDVQLRRVRVHVAVRRRVGRDRRIDVEAVDRGVRIGGPRFLREFAVGGDHGGAVIDRAGILPSGPAQPRLPVGIVIGFGWRGVSLPRRSRILAKVGRGLRQARGERDANYKQLEHSAS